MIEYRNATQSELSDILGWARSEGWNPGLDDADAFFAADPDGFFVATENGAPVASISVVNHSRDFAFLGLYIALPSHRGKGAGYALWQHAILHAGDRTIGLDGVPEQQANYAASGFRPAGGTTRFTGQIAPIESPAVRMVRGDDIPSLIKKEAVASGTQKATYLGAWFEAAPNRTTLVTQDGFCTVRKCVDGAKIGPLMAENATTAEALIRHSAALFGPDLTIDVPNKSAALAEKCLSLGMNPGFETARMYKGDPPLSRETPWFAVTSLELG